MDELRFTYTEADYLTASKLHMNRGVRRYLSKAIVVVAFLLALLLLLDTRNVVLAILVFVAPVLLVFSTTSVYLPYLVKKRMREMKPLREEIVLRIQEGKIETESAAGKGEFTWLLNVVQSHEMLLLMVNQLSFVMVPRRVCTDDAQFERIAAVGRKLAEKEKA